VNPFKTKGVQTVMQVSI